jgi:hypothetical protein
MAGINKIKQFCTTGNVLTEAEYEALRASGNVKGRASSAFVNKALKQSSYVAAGLAEAVAEVYNNGVDETASLTEMVDGIKALIEAYVGQEVINNSITYASLPVGAITMFTGTQGDLDAFYSSNGVRWYLCNGQNGTPDLRDRFVVGSGGSYAVGATGGANSVTLTEAQMPSHTHKVADGSGQFDATYGNNVTLSGAMGSAMNTDAKGGSQPHENRPPYYALAYIMKGA